MFFSFGGDSSGLVHVITSRKMQLAQSKLSFSFLWYASTMIIHIVSSSNNPGTSVSEKVEAGIYSI